MNTECKLMPCPFCDGKAEIEDWIVGYESGTTITCRDCGACISEGIEDGDGYHERAVAKWNRRARPAAQCRRLGGYLF